jgi:sugar lactone lactonase YvrE
MPRKGKPGQLIVFDPAGKLLRVVDVTNSTNLLLDLAFHPQTGDLLLVDFGGKQVLKVDPMTGVSSVFMKIPDLKRPGTKVGPNAPAFDKDGNVYVSDSFQGVIWKAGPKGGDPVEWVSGSIFLSKGTPRFGANGLGFNRAGTSLFVGNTGNDQIIRVPVTNGVAGKPEVFVNSINGPDGLFVDEEDRIWTTANQADEIVVVDPTGRVVAKLGDFEGLDAQSAPKGLLFPGALYPHGKYVYVANLAFDMRRLGAVQTVDGQWSAATTTYTIVRIPIPEKYPFFK